jgi:hypothetical protein
MRTEMRAVDVKRESLDMGLYNSLSDEQFCEYCGNYVENPIIPLDGAEQFCSKACMHAYYYRDEEAIC